MYCIEASVCFFSDDIAGTCAEEEGKGRGLFPSFTASYQGREEIDVTNRVRGMELEKEAKTYTEQQMNGHRKEGIEACSLGKICGKKRWKKGTGREDKQGKKEVLDMRRGRSNLTLMSFLPNLKAREPQCTKTYNTHNNSQGKQPGHC